ncbi:MAG: energy transducer TonB [Sphingomonas sp.]|uniref:energy transducer TonB n=1 Tax=Sphingomonas sp. TaxID=28214 RepID=UPI00179003D1|nr:energy transducer TonB [Sphingomonas sp.]MBA3667096.1 energy transducer TonB [Sphingomonas sp.]
MLAYATDTRPARAKSPRLLVFVILGHLAAVGALLTTKMVLEGPVISDPIDVINIDTPKPPPPPPPDPRPTAKPPAEPSVTRADPTVKIPTWDPPISFDPVIKEPALPTGTGNGNITAIDPPKPVPVRVAARFATPDALLRPPYPVSKIRSEEEASLRLKLSIDAQGRVVAVDPVGAADPIFLAAARRHLLRAWRYKPAMDDGVAVPSSVVITLSFKLDNA